MDSIVKQVNDFSTNYILSMENVHTLLSVGTSVQVTVVLVVVVGQLPQFDDRML